jgi:hypothetical protein
MLKICVYRYCASLAYQRDPAKGNDWHNNDGNNSLDLFTLKDADSGATLFTCHVQTVANAEGLIAGVHAYDTIAPGPFQMRAFVEPRLFICQPHGIVNTKTMHGDLIIAELDAKGRPTVNDSTTARNKSRWLTHDWKDHSGKDTRVAWSAGCFVLPDEALSRYNAILTQRGVKPFDLIDGVLEEEAAA